MGQKYFSRSLNSLIEYGLFLCLCHNNCTITVNDLRRNRTWTVSCLRPRLQSGWGLSRLSLQNSAPHQTELCILRGAICIAISNQANACWAWPVCTLADRDPAGEDD